MVFARLRLAARTRARPTPLESLNMLPLYFSTRRTARVLGLLFVLAAALGWVAAGYDLGELRVIHPGEPLEPGRSARARRGRRADRGCADRVRGAARGGVRAVAPSSARESARARRAPAALPARVDLPRLRDPGAQRLPALPGRERGLARRATPRASTRSAGSGCPTSRLVLAWWLGSRGGWRSRRSRSSCCGSRPGVAHVQIAHALALAGDVSAAVSASLGYFVVARISAAQDAKWALFGRGEGAADLGAVYGSAVGAGGLGPPDRVRANPLATGNRLAQPASRFSTEAFARPMRIGNPCRRSAPASPH